MDNAKLGPVVSRRQVFGAAFAVVALNMLPSWLKSASAYGGTAGSELTLARFTPWVGSSLSASQGRSRAARVTLVEATGRAPRPVERGRVSGEAFSLIFSSGSTPLNEGSYTLKHPSMGTVSLFLVPVGRSVRGQRYQAVVDHRRPSR